MWALCVMVVVSCILVKTMSLQLDWDLNTSNQMANMTVTTQHGKVTIVTVKCSSCAYLNSASNKLEEGMVLII